MLEIVTVSAADQSVEPEELVDVWKHFPNVEWGIQLSNRNGGYPRFPSMDWIERLAAAKAETTKSGKGMRLSLHICGDALRHVVGGSLGWLPEFLLLSAFERVQLNWHGLLQPEGTARLIEKSFRTSRWKPTVICQLDGVVGNHMIAGDLAALGMRVAGLYDQSHGAGVSPKFWGPALSYMDVGWAGGLGPDNVERELARINVQANNDRPWWIDTETKVRTDRNFDLTKVISFLERVQRWEKGSVPRAANVP